MSFKPLLYATCAASVLVLSAPAVFAQTERPGDQRLTTPLPPTTGTEAKAVSLSEVDRPDRTLVNTPVESKDGHKIGEVAQVTLDARGKAREVVLKAGTRIAAGKLLFVPDRGVLVAQLTPSEMAPAPSQPAPAIPPPTLPPTPSTPPDPGSPGELPPNKPGY